MDDIPEAPSPVSVELDRATALTVTWPDGRRARFGLEDLRVSCPCAECRGRRERDLPVWPQPSSPRPLAATGAELVGAWGITITWNDGHATGIYSWGVLHEWAATGDDTSG